MNLFFSLIYCISPQHQGKHLAKLKYETLVIFLLYASNLFAEDRIVEHKRMKSSVPADQATGQVSQSLVINSALSLNFIHQVLVPFPQTQ